MVLILLIGTLIIFVPNLEHGCERAIREAGIGIVSGILLNAFISSGLIPSSYITLFKLIIILTILSLIMAMPYWGTGYIIGWLLGMLIMAETGLISTFDIIIYTVIPFVLLILRFTKNM